MDLTFTRLLPLSCDQAFRCMNDEGFQRLKAEALGAQDFSMSVSAGPQGPVVATRRRLPTDALPEFVKSMVQPMMTVVETETWGAPAADGSRRGAFTLDVHGAPVRMRGDVSLTPADGGCELAFTGVLSATVPLFRARIEAASSASVLHTMETEADLLTAATADGPAG